MLRYVPICVASVLGFLLLSRPIGMPCQIAIELNKWTTSSIAVLIEPRQDARLIPIAFNFVANLPTNWRIMIFHSNLNHNQVQSLQARLPLGKLIINRSYFGNQTNININAALTDPRLWELIPAEKVLIFQIDSVICSRSPYAGYLEKFLRFDYIGAPWRPDLLWASPYQFVGNGGLSIRSKSWILRILGNTEWSSGENEDMWFSRKCRELGCTLPTKEQAAQFALETWFDGCSRPWGVHKPWQHLSPGDLHVVKQNCPEITLAYSEDALSHT